MVFFIFIQINIQKANSGNPNQMPHSAASGSALFAYVLQKGCQAYMGWILNKLLNSFLKKSESVYVVLHDNGITFFHDIRYIVVQKSFMGFYLFITL